MRSFIYQSDFVSAINAVIEYGKVGNTYHFSDNDIYKIRDVVKIVCEQLNEDFYEFVIDQPDRPAKDLMYNLDISSSKEIGWGPKINLKVGIADTIKWIEENKSAFLEMSTDYVYIP
jgi:dTDP-glucose 4,6-dehydratase